MGSGTSVIAGLQSGLGLRCIGIEIDKAAFATAEQRIKEYL
jgi:DNA modification methylase